MSSKTPRIELSNKAEFQNALGKLVLSPKNAKDQSVMQRPKLVQFLIPVSPDLTNPVTDLESKVVKPIQMRVVAPERNYDEGSDEE